jgi:hypothetical protein
VTADHFSLMALDALLIAVFFAFLWKPTALERWRYFLKVFGLLLLGAVAVGWLMYGVPPR